MKVLVIEDNAANKKFLVDILDITGCEVLTASDAQTGIMIAREEKPQIILMDIQLPGMNGLEATKILKSDPQTSKTKIVATTAMAMKGDKERIIQAGCDAYIAKPIHYKELLSILESLIKTDG